MVRFQLHLHGHFNYNNTCPPRIIVRQSPSAGYASQIVYPVLSADLFSAACLSTDSLRTPQGGFSLAQWVVQVSAERGRQRLQANTYMIMCVMQHGVLYTMRRSDTYFRDQEPCESRGGRPGLPFLISLRFLWT